MSLGLKNDKVTGKSRLRSCAASMYHLFLRYEDIDYKTILCVFISSAFTAQSPGSHTKILGAEYLLSTSSAGTDVYRIGYQCGCLPMEDFCVASYL